jgi:peptidoglycan hydrolase CwlO-like protein
LSRKAKREINRLKAVIEDLEDDIARMEEDLPDERRNAYEYGRYYERSLHRE